MNWHDLQKYLVRREFNELESEGIYLKSEDIYRYFREVQELAVDNLPTYKVQWKQPQKPVEVNTDELMEVLL